MTPSIGRRRAYDPDARPIPTTVYVFASLAGLLTLVIMFLDSAGAAASEADQTASLLLKLMSLVFVCLIAWTMTWRDELENTDGLRIACAFVPLAAAEVSLLVGLQAPGLVIASAGQAVLMWRNSLGLRVALKKGLVPLGRLLESAVGYGCCLAAAALFIMHHVKTAMGTATAAALGLWYLVLLLAVLMSVAATYCERWPKQNSSEMLRGTVVLLVSGVAQGASWALEQDTQNQVAVCCLAWVLRLLALAAIAVSAYRRKVKPSSGGYM